MPAHNTFPRYTLYLRRRDASCRVVCEPGGHVMTLRRAYRSSQRLSISGVFAEFEYATAVFFLDEEIVRVDEFSGG